MLAAQENKAQTLATPSTVSVSDKQNGQSIDLMRNQTLVVLLPSNPSTGFSWIVAGESEPLKLLKSQYHKSSASGQKAGAGGTQQLRFSANQSGIAQLTLEYRRSWEHDMPAAKTFRLTVNVR